MPMSSKFLTESTGEKIVKIGQYFAQIWTKNDSLVFWATLYIYRPGTKFYSHVKQKKTRAVLSQGNRTKP